MLAANMYEATRGRKSGVVVLDPLDGVVYRKLRSGRFQEVPSLQEMYEEKGRAALRQYASVQYQGFAEGVVVL